MIKHLSITPPIIGRISIGRVVEKNGKRLPEKDDQFTITTQIQTRDGWLLHPMDEALRKDSSGGKLRSIPVTMLFDDPELNLRAEYTLFDKKTGRLLCSGDGESCQRQTENGIQELPCPSPDQCPLATNNACKPYGRLSVRVGDDDDVGVFIFRTTGYNSIRTLSARLRYYHALSGGVLASLPLSLKLRGKSTTQSHRTPIYYVDLAIREDTTLNEAISMAHQSNAVKREQGLDQKALDDAARNSFTACNFEYMDGEGLQVLEEFIPEAGTEPDTTTSPEAEPRPSVSDLSQKLAQRHSSSA